jgi:hypothetical protein
MINSFPILLPASRHAQIGYHPLKVALMVQHDLRAYYLPLYRELANREIELPAALLAFAEGLLCQGEEQMEIAAKAGESDVFAAWRQSKAQVLDLLAEEQITHPRIQRYLEEVEAFFSLIHQLVYQGRLTHANVVRAMELAPSDFRLMHIIFCCATGLPVNEALLDLLEPLEVLRDIHWHRTNLADDVEHGYFNLYQMFTRIHGAEAERQIQAEEERLSALLAERLARATAQERAQVQPMLAAYRAAIAP